VGKKNDLIARLAFALRDEEKTLESKRKAFEDLSEEESPTKKVCIEDQDYIVKFTLPRHACFRVLSVPGKMKFLDALEGILESFGFDIDHLFVIRKPPELYAPSGKEIALDSECKIGMRERSCGVTYQ